MDLLRIPLGDWYETLNADYINFRARSVVGGVFMKSLDHYLRNKRNRLWKSGSKIMQFGGLFLFMSCNQPVDVSNDRFVKEEAEIPPSCMVSFEEITHSGDGGLYAEMIEIVALKMVLYLPVRC